jgi:hypothetical protein
MNKKIGLWLATVVLLLVWCPPLAAEARTFGPFTLEVPGGWETDYEEGCLTMLAEAPQSMLMVCSLPLEGQPFGEAVLEIAEVFNSVPKRDGDGDYSFQFTNEQTGLVVHAVVTEEDGSIKLVGLAGEHPDLEKILGSLEEK